MGQIVPQVFVSRAVIEQSVYEILYHPKIETVWAEYGLVFPNGNVIMTGIIVPNHDDIDRKDREAEIGGGTYVGTAQQWLEANWKLAQKVGAVSSKGIFTKLHIGHSHQRLGIKEYSSQDKQTILESIEKYGLTVAIGMLANIDQNTFDLTRQRFSPEPLFVSGKWTVRLRFYYLSRDMVDRAVKEPKIITPQIVATKDVPIMPPLGWQTLHEVRFNDDLRQLKNYGCVVEVKYVSKDNKYPYDIRFVIANRERRWKGNLYVTISWDYPKNGNLTYEVKPIMGRPGSVSKHPNSELCESPVVRKDESLIELVWRLEARGEL